jgi:hypothetical protein
MRFVRIMQLPSGVSFPLDSLDKRDFRSFKIILSLKVHPTLGVGAEETGETQGRVSGDGTISGTDFIDAALGNSDGFGQPVAPDSLAVLSAAQDFRHLLQDQLSGGHDWSSVNMRKPYNSAFLSTIKERKNHRFTRCIF